MRCRTPISRRTGGLAVSAASRSSVTWLTRIVINQALMRLRRQKRDRVVVPFSGGRGASPEHPRCPRNGRSRIESPPDATMRAEIRRMLERRIDELPVAFRTVFVMREVEDMSVEETAACSLDSRGDGAHPAVPRESSSARITRARHGLGNGRSVPVRRRAMRSHRGQRSRARQRYRFALIHPTYSPRGTRPRAPASNLQNPFRPLGRRRDLRGPADVEVRQKPDTTTADRRQTDVVSGFSRTQQINQSEELAHEIVGHCHCRVVAIARGGRIRAGCHRRADRVDRRHRQSGRHRRRQARQGRWAATPTSRSSPSRWSPTTPASTSRPSNS